MSIAQTGQGSGAVCVEPSCPSYGIRLPQALSSATYDAANELTQWDGTNLTYDANGSLTSDGANTYTWNARNQLATVTDAGTGTTLASFQYDAFGRRTGNAAGNQVFYDGANAVQELSGTTPVVNRLTGGVDEFFSRTDSSGTTFPLTDALGSTIALTDSSGAIQTQYAYAPFGAVTPSGTSSGNWYQFTGRVNDGTGLYYYRARYYSPRFKRFISQDPAGIAGGFNFYAYAGDSPVNFRDPSGLKPNACQSILCSPLFWGLALGVAMPEALPLELGLGMEAGWGADFAATEFTEEGVEAVEPLENWAAKTFENGEYTASTLDQPMTVYRADTYAFPGGSNPEFYGTEMPGSAGQANDLYNITAGNSANQMNYVNTYQIPAGTPVYEGPVAGGSGTQIFLPGGESAVQIGTQLLPK